MNLFQAITEKVVSLIGTVTDLRRIASAHVIDHNQLKDDELRSALVKSKPQYAAAETVSKALAEVLRREPKDSVRALSRVLLVDVLLDQYDCLLPFQETDAKVHRGRAERPRPLQRAGPRAARLRRQVHPALPRPGHLQLRPRRRLGTARQRFARRSQPAQQAPPPPARQRVRAPRPRSQAPPLPQDRETSSTLAPRSTPHAAASSKPACCSASAKKTAKTTTSSPTELANELRAALRIELRADAYRELLKFHKVRTKAHLSDILERQGVRFAKSDKVDALVERVVLNVPPRKAIASASPRYGLSGEELADWCRDLDISPTGTIDEKVQRVVSHFAALRPRARASSRRALALVRVLHRLRQSETVTRAAGPAIGGGRRLSSRRAAQKPRAIESQRELQGDAEGPTTTSGTHQAASAKMLNDRGSDPRSPPRAGSAATSRRGRSRVSRPYPLPCSLREARLRASASCKVTPKAHDNQRHPSGGVRQDAQ